MAVADARALDLKHRPEIDARALGHLPAADPSIPCVLRGRIEPFLFRFQLGVEAFLSFVFERRQDMPIRQRHRLDLISALGSKSGAENRARLLQLALRDQDLREKLAGDRVFLLGAQEVGEDLARRGPASSPEITDGGIQLGSPLEIARLFSSPRSLGADDGPGWRPEGAGRNLGCQGKSPENLRNLRQDKKPQAIKHFCSNRTESHISTVEATFRVEKAVGP